MAILQARGSITTSDDPAPDGDSVGRSSKRRFGRSYGVEQLAAGKEYHAGAGDRQQPAAPAWIGVEIVGGALDRPQRDGVNHQPRLKARLDDEKSSDLFEHCHSLTSERADGGFEPKISC